MDKKTIKILTITEYDNKFKIIGSRADPNINNEVISDIDTQEIINDIDYDDILKHFQKVFKKLKNNKKIIITDFKTGWNNLTQKPYRWNYKTIQQGYQYDEENTKINFIDTLKQKSIIKIDTIIYLDKEYIELTMNYYFNYKDNSKSYEKKSKKEILTDINEDIIKYKNGGNYYKALKRLNSLLKILGKTDKELINIINSSIGILAKEKSRLETLLYLKENTKIKIKETKEYIVNKIEELNKKINTNKLKSILNNIYIKYKDLL